MYMFSHSNYGTGAMQVRQHDPSLSSSWHESVQKCAPLYKWFDMLWQFEATWYKFLENPCGVVARTDFLQKLYR